MRTKRLIGKALALVVALLMMLTLLPASALASDRGLEFHKNTNLNFDTPTTLIKGATGKEAGTGLIMVKAVGYDHDTVSCVSADPSVAKVVDAGTGSGGNYKYQIEGLTENKSTTITVAATDNPDDKKVFEVNVIDPPSVKLTTNEAVIVNGEKETIGAYFFPSTSEITDTTVTPTASPSGVVDVTQKMDGADPAKDGDYFLYEIEGLAPGHTTITFTSNGDTTKTEDVEVDVVDNLLTVKYGSTIKGYKTADFENEGVLAPTTVSPQGSDKNICSGRNHYYSFKSVGKATGTPVETILRAALGDEFDNLKRNQIIRFIASDDTEEEPQRAEITVDRLLYEQRSYFPNANKDSVKEGAIPTDEESAGAIPFTTMICKKGSQKSRLLFGQLAANERNWANSIQNMTTGGTIEVLDDVATPITCDVTASIASGSTIEPGTQVTLNSPQITTYDILYTTDGTDPTWERGAVYNYNTKPNEGESMGLATIKAPDAEGTFVLKVRQIAYNKLDSNVVTFTYKVERPVAAGRTYTVGGSSYKVDKEAAGTTPGTATFAKAKNAKSVVVPKTVKLADGKVYNVTAVGGKAFTGKKIRTVTVGANVSKIAKYAFKGSKATKTILKTKKLTKKNVKGSLKGSKVKRIQVKVGSKKLNKKYVKKYKKYFTKKNAGKRVTVK